MASSQVLKIQNAKARRTGGIHAEVAEEFRRDHRIRQDAKNELF
jgi:hypothetical protein